MPLIKCPECGKEISDKASVCIGCGFPIKEHLTKIEEERTSEENEKEIELERERKIKEIYWCRSCYRQNEVGEEYCAYCGNRLFFCCSDNAVEEAQKALLDRIYISEEGKRVKIIKALQEEKGFDLSTAKEIVDNYWNERFPTKELHYTKHQPIQTIEREESQEVVKKEFSGIYKYVPEGWLKTKKIEVYCPRCHSENCSYFTEQAQQQVVIPAKKKTRYTANLNPLKPFTLVNKKEKVVKKERVETEVRTEQRIICNSCGFVFD